MKYVTIEKRKDHSFLAQSIEELKEEWKRQCD